MADWRQIQARIRKAKNSLDPAAKLSELYQRTRDGMVAWEIGAVEEKNGRSDEAVKWYKVAAEKFRRADWKKKAEDALARFGVETPEKQQAVEDEPELHRSELEALGGEAHEEQSLPLAVGEVSEDADEAGEEDEVQPVAAASNAQQGVPADGNRKKRRRGRRGGRGRRRRGGAGTAPGLPAQAFASSGPSTQKAPSAQVQQPMAAASAQQERVPYETPQREPQRAARPEPAYQPPQLPSERAAHGRSDPALSSRMAHRLGEADEAPAGPGVFLLSEADQSGSYYVEACQTLRVGVGNLVRGVRTQKGNRGRFNETNLKQQLAEYLGINEAKVSQYLRDHCVVRWIQLDDEATNLAHFAIGILRTPLNID